MRLELIAWSPTENGSLEMKEWSKDCLSKCEMRTFFACVPAHACVSKLEEYHYGSNICLHFNATQYPSGEILEPYYLLCHLTYNNGTVLLSLLVWTHLPVFVTPKHCYLGVNLEDEWMEPHGILTIWGLSPKATTVIFLCVNSSGHFPSTLEDWHANRHGESTDSFSVSLGNIISRDYCTGG